MTELDEKQESGVAFISGIMGERFGNAFREAATTERFGAQVTRMAASAAFHDAWQHEGISRKEKSIAIISSLIALRQPSELKNHVKIGLANGLTVDEIEGILIQLTPYVGFPCVATAGTAMVEALREAGELPETEKTSEERGLL
ncbi:MAG: carboxymuconolactone decarboxylase [Alphaproteobacteria bacterium]|nr:carboxymuconolactone decarboxylase [Alphaproteobacteria bacterium]